MECNQNGLDLIKSFEGCKLDAYQDSVGIWTVGYGCTVGVKEGDTVTQEEAEAWLRKNVDKLSSQLTGLFKVGVTGNQFSACICLSYNIGVGNFIKSTLLRLVNAQEFDKAGMQFLVWNKAGGRVLAGLSKRRMAEKELFDTPDKA